MNICNLFKTCLVTLILFFSLQTHATSISSSQANELSTKHAAELKELLARKVLRVAMYKGNTWPFYFQREINGKKGKLEGIDVEIITGFANKLGLEVVFLRSETLDGAVDMVADGRADLAICKLSITFSRASKVLFTKPYIKLKKGLLVNRVGLQQLQNKLGNLSKKETIQILAGNVCAMKNSPYAYSVNRKVKQVGDTKCSSKSLLESKDSMFFIDYAFEQFQKMSIQDFNAWRALGVIENSSYVGFANQRFRQMEVKQFPNWQNVVDDISSGELLAGFRDEAEVKKVIFENKGLSVDLLTVVLENDFDPKGIALPPNANYLKSLLDFYIDSLGLELTANAVIFEYDNVIEHLNRYKDSETE